MTDRSPSAGRPVGPHISGPKILLQYLRINRGVSQVKLHLDSGVSLATIQRIESMEASKTTLKTLYNLAVALQYKGHPTNLVEVVDPETANVLLADKSGENKSLADLAMTSGLKVAVGERKPTKPIRPKAAGPSRSK